MFYTPNSTQLLLPTKIYWIRFKVYTLILLECSHEAEK